jgi:outer membrane immunogenic protein
MKKAFLPGIVLSVLAAGPAMSADLPLRSVYKAPPPPAVWFDWSGFYVGGHVGYGWGDADIADFTLSYKKVLLPARSIDAEGFLGGVQGGWNYQFGPFVLGAELEFSWSDIKGDVTSAIVAGKGQGQGAGSTSLSSNATWISTAAARFGYAWDGFLVYGKIGAAFAQFDYDNNITFTVGRTTTVGNASASDTRSGWIVGTGVEWAFASDWSAKAEYNYMDFGSRKVDFASFGGGPVSLDIDQRISVIKAGVNYHFGNNVVVAKY